MSLFDLLLRFCSWCTGRSQSCKWGVEPTFLLYIVMWLCGHWGVFFPRCHFLCTLFFGGQKHVHAYASVVPHGRLSVWGWFSVHFSFTARWGGQFCSFNKSIPLSPYPFDFTWSGFCFVWVGYCRSLSDFPFLGFYFVLRDILPGIRCCVTYACCGFLCYNLIVAGFPLSGLSHFTPPISQDCWVSICC